MPSLRMVTERDFRSRSDFGQHHRQVLLLTGELPDRRRDFGRREDRGCHLIQQWLENVVITPVDQKHFGIALPQRPRRGHAAKTATDYHDSRLPLDVHALSAQLQDEGAKSFVNSWNDLMGVIGSKCAVLTRAS